MSAVRNYADRHRVLLGLHADRRRAAHAGAAALLPARLLAVHARLPVPALRDRRHRRQSRRRLAGDALRHPAHAGGRPGAADRRPAHAVGARSRLERRPSRSPGWWWRRASPASPRTSPRPRRNRRSRRRPARAAGQLFRWVAWFTGSKNAMKGVGFFVGGLLLDVVGFRPALWLMAGAARRRSSSRACCSLPRAARQGQVVEDRARAVRQVARRQPAGGRAHLPVRRARRLVRRRPAGVPLRQRLALRRGRRLPGGLDHRLRRRAGDRAVAGARAAPTA